MIIGIDGNEANVSQRVGIGEYAFELITQFSKFRVQNLEFRIYLKKPPRNDLPKERNGWVYRVIGPSKLWTQIGLPFDLYFHNARPDVFFSPTHYAPRFSPVPSVISVMDLSYIHFPELFKNSDLYQLKNWTKYSIEKSACIFTISEASKDDIIKEYAVPEGQVVVTYPGLKDDLTMKSISENEFKKKYNLGREYILFIGTIQPRKNIAKLIEAFSLFLKKREKPNVDLVIVGKKGWLYEEIFAAPGIFGVSENVKFLDFVSDEDLASFYKGAEFFILPSLYEGFGLPVLEAMRYGCPVITSNISSLPEVGGDAALYIDPNNINDITEKMETLYIDKKLRQALIKKGYAQIKKFSWEKTAKQTLEVLEKVAKGGTI